jgi:hypothetical protein
MFDNQDTSVLFQDSNEVLDELYLLEEGILFSLESEVDELVLGLQLLVSINICDDNCIFCFGKRVLLAVL